MNRSLILLGLLAAGLTAACGNHHSATAAGGYGSSQGTGGGGLTSGAAGESAAPPAGGAPACGAVAPEDGFTDVGASNQGIRYVGRLDFSAPEAPKLSYPAITIETRFAGDAIDLRLEESAQGGSTGTAYYEVVVDAQAPVKLETCTTQSVYPLARELGVGMHTANLLGWPCFAGAQHGTAWLRAQAHDSDQYEARS